MIIGEIRRYLRDNNSIRVSRSLRDIAYKALSARERLSALHNREPLLSEIAEELGLPDKQVNNALDAIADPISLYEPVYHDGGEPVFVMDQIGDDRNTDEQWIDDLNIKEALSKLSERERKIINLRFFDGRTQMEIAEEIGISQAQVSRLEKGALAALRKYV